MTIALFLLVLFAASIPVAVAIGITVAVYGVVALIVKLDDIGLHLAEKPNGAARAFGNGLDLFREHRGEFGDRIVVGPALKMAAQESHRYCPLVSA